MELAYDSDGDVSAPRKKKHRAAHCVADDGREFAEAQSVPSACLVVADSREEGEPTLTAASVAETAYFWRGAGSFALCDETLRALRDCAVRVCDGPMRSVAIAVLDPALDAGAYARLCEIATAAAAALGAPEPLDFLSVCFDDALGKGHETKQSANTLWNLPLQNTNQKVSRAARPAAAARPPQRRLRDTHTHAWTRPFPFFNENCLRI